MSRTAIQFPSGEDDDRDHDCPEAVVDGDQGNTQGSCHELVNGRCEIEEDGNSDGNATTDDDGFENDGPDQVNDDENEISCVCLICDELTTGSNAADLMKSHLESVHKLSFDKLKASFDMNYSSFVQFVRWAREMKASFVGEVSSMEEIIRGIWDMSGTPPKNLPWSQEKYLLPPEDQDNSNVDMLLTLDFFASDDRTDQACSAIIPTADAETATDGVTVNPVHLADLVAEIERLRLDNKQMTDVFTRIILTSGGGAEQSTTTRGSESKQRKKSPIKGMLAEHNKCYFDSYDDITIHHDMIFDEARTNAYREAIEDRGLHIKNNIVMDLGCGTGILSMFCADQGAHRVHAIDKSNIIYDGISNSFENNFNNVIKFHHLDLDNDDTSELDKGGLVDILVSEFMGYFLFFEGMTESFIRARDKYLKHGGAIMPNRGTVELAPLGPNGIYKRKVLCWDSVYGYSMPAMKNRILKEPLIDFVSPSEIIGDRVPVKNLDFNKCLECEIYIADEPVFKFTKDSEFCGIVGFFSVFFDGLTKTVTLSTSPWDKPTHWKQTVFLFPKPMKVSKGQMIQASFKSCPHIDDPRWLTILIEVEGCQHVYELK